MLGDWVGLSSPSCWWQTILSSMRRELDGDDSNYKAWERKCSLMMNTVMNLQKF